MYASGWLTTSLTSTRACLWSSNLHHWSPERREDKDVRLAADWHICKNSRKGKGCTDAQVVQDSNSASPTLKSTVSAQLQFQLVHGKVTTQRVAKQAVCWQTSCTEQSHLHSREQLALLECISGSTQQWSARLTCVLHIGPVVALPNAPLVDDHSTQLHLSNSWCVSVVAVGGMVWTVWGQVVLHVQPLAILDAAVQLPWLWTLRGVMMKARQSEDERIWDGVGAEPLVSHLLPAATMERHIGLCL